ncbi:MAG: family 78 glycoside hydrolase catalytic domain [Mariniphaga sp.]
MTHDIAKNSYTFDFGREVAGTVFFRTSGKAGTAITITPVSSAPATVLIGSVSNSSCKFVLAGSEVTEVYAPRFYKIAINKIEIAGATQTPKLEDVRVHVISGGWDKAGSFSCSDGVINAMEDIVRRTSAYYTTFLPDDPTREWKAWTQDIICMFVPNTYLFDAHRMYERWQLDMAGDQREDGNVPKKSYTL